MYMSRNAYTRPRNVKFAVTIPFSYDKIKPREAQEKHKEAAPCISRYVMIRSRSWKSSRRFCRPGSLTGAPMSAFRPSAAADIIFLTTSPGFAYESYGVRAAEYLLKPINAKLLYPVLDKLYLRDQKPQDGLTVKSNGMLVRLPFSQLSYVEVNGKHLFFNMADGTVYEVAASMREYEGALLARPEFMRVHRSYIVNMLQAEKLSPAGVITFSGHNVPVSRLLYGQLQKDYLALLFSGRDA